MISINYEFGDADVSCSNCGFCENIKGFGGHISFDFIADKLRGCDWKTTKEDGEWKHFCPDCKKKL